MRVSLRSRLRRRFCEALEQAFNLGHAFIQGCDIPSGALAKGGNVLSQSTNGRNNDPDQFLVHVVSIAIPVLIQT